MKMQTSLLSLLTVFLLLLPLHAEDAKIDPITIENADIDVKELSLLLKPLTADELTAEADGWQGLLKEKVEALSNAQIAGEKEEALAPLRAARKGVADRMDAVINELGFKGGETETYQTYSDAVSGLIDINTDDPLAFVAQTKSWLMSPDGGIKLLLAILKFLAIIWIAKIISKFVGKIIRRVLDKSGGNVSNLLKDFIVNSIRRLIVILGFVMGLSALGVNIGPLLAGLGVLGFVVGFALQDTLGNFAAGFMILLNRPYDINDLVEVDGKQGVVSAMSLVSTTINTLDNQKIVVPNGKIWGGTITNITGNPTRRVDLMFGIDYSDDPEKAKNVLQEICAGCDLILESPAPDIEVHELADSSVNLLCRPWCKTADYWKVHWHVTETVKQRFDQEGLSFPFPQQDVNMKPA